MLVKLLKYDLKYMIKNMLVFYILSIFFAITTRILFEMEQTIIIDIIGQISVGCMFSMTASTLINTIMRSWVRFKDSLYKDESYLTHTLPVTKKQLYDSKIIQTLILFLIGFAVILLSLFITYYSKENWIGITNYIKNITTGLNINIWFFIIMLVVILFLELFNAVQCGYLGMILGYQKNNSKLGFSVLFGFIIYIIIQTIVVFLIFIYGLIDPSIMELFKSTTPALDIEVFKTLAIITSMVYSLVIIAISILCKKLLNKGVNIE